ncbi:RHS repeat-associated core domain-containing protein [Undibacterium flavidum]|nr:RHS repeat-associated core domain-containing protein [Undibacterium flavidum]
MRYDAALRIQQVTHAKGNIIHARTDYVFDQNGNRTKETINRNAAAQVTNYSYDKADRLTQTEVIDVNQTVTTAYTLDSVANRTKEIISTKPAGTGSTSSTGSTGSPTSITKTYTYDGRNQLTAITDTAAGNTTLSYDSQGNLSQKTQGSDSTYYSYNARDNLISVRKNNTVLGNYSNNHLGLRVEKEAKDPLQPNAPPAIFRTLWNGRHAFQDSDTSGNTLSRYENDGRHTVSLWSSTDGSQALHHDALGSITATTDNSGQLKSETVYDAFGNIVSQSGQSANKFGYTGHQMDQETGLIYFQARYYDPQTGRFITQDPYEGDWNTPLSLHHYLYAYGNPTTYIDLHGYQSRKPYYMSIDPVTGQKTFGDRPPAPNADQQAANNIAREQERARRTLADKTRPSNNIDDPEFVQRRLTREAAHKPGIGGDEVEELPSQIQLRQMHSRAKLAFQIGGEIVEGVAPTPETIIAGPLVGGILNKAKPLLPFLKEAAKDTFKAKKTEQTIAKIESVEVNGAEQAVLKNEQRSGNFYVPSRDASLRKIENDVDKWSLVPISDRQKKMIADKLSAIKQRSSELNRELRRDFEKNQKNLIKRWEAETGENWPSGATPHHIIPLKNGGGNEWWNLAPVKNPHTGTIHGTGSALRTELPYKIEPGTISNLK